MAAPTHSITTKAKTAMSYLGSHISEALHILHDPKVACMLPLPVVASMLWPACCPRMLHMVMCITAAQSMPPHSALMDCTFLTLAQQ
jgi:hypothetical protein